MKKEGISLITLVITIVVVIILASVVILSIGKNNPIENARIANVTETKDTIESRLLMYASSIKTKTLGEFSTKEILIDKENYKIVSGQETSIMVDEEDISLYEISKEYAKEKLNLELKSITNNSSWYIDENGKAYLIFEDENIPNYFKENDSITPILRGFVAQAGEIIKPVEEEESEDLQLPDEVPQEEAIAKINDKYYRTVSVALKYVPENNEQTTIQLLKDTSEKITIGTNQNVILDLNEKEISNDGENRVIENNGTLELKKGTVSSTVDYYTVTNTGTLTIDNITMTGASNSHTLYNNGGNLTINTGTISSTNSNAVRNNSGTITISGNAKISNDGSREGTTSVYPAVWNSGTLQIDNGTISSTNAQAVYIKKGNAYINGGSYSTKSTKNNVYVAAEGNLSYYTGVSFTLGQASGATVTSSNTKVSMP